MKWFKSLEILKKLTIIILSVCIAGMILSLLVKPYRGTWIYQYGNPLANLMFCGGIVCSLINSIGVIFNYRRSFKPNQIWIFLSALPVLYISIMITIAMI